MSSDQVVATWVFMVLSRLRRRLNLPTAEFAGLVLANGLVGFLYAHHELLHYYDDDAVCDDVMTYVVSGD